jgi:hypothetical protein
VHGRLPPGFDEHDEDLLADGQTGGASVEAGSDLGGVWKTFCESQNLRCCVQPDWVGFPIAEPTMNGRNSYETKREGLADQL